MNKIIRRTTPFYILLLSSAIHAATLDLSLENITEITREYITKKLDERKIPYTQFTDIKLPHKRHKNWRLRLPTIQLSNPH